MVRSTRLSSALLIFLAVTIGLLACNESFDEEKWKSKGVDWQLSDSREKMVQDLVNSDTLLGLNKAEVHQMLGTPEMQASNDSTMQYLIREKYSLNIDPEYIKYFTIKFDRNGLVKSYHLEKIE